MILCLCPNPAIDMYSWLNAWEAGQVNIPQQEERFPGGKGVHVALALAVLKEPVTLLGFWGGPTGQWVREQCETRGIICEGPNLTGWTRTCLTLKGHPAINETELLGQGPAITATDYQNFKTIFVRLAATAHLITMSGSWPQAAPPDAYAQLIAEAHQAGKKVILDCTGPQLPPALAQNPFAVHINKQEGEHLYHTADPQALATLLARQCTYAAVTAGAAGLYLATPQEFIWASCALPRIYSAVGSGDCLVAGLAIAIKNNISPAETARLGVACGSANCLRPDLGMLYRDDVVKLLHQVKLAQPDISTTTLNCQG